MDTNLFVLVSSFDLYIVDALMILNAVLNYIYAFLIHTRI